MQVREPVSYYENNFVGSVNLIKVLSLLALLVPAYKS